MNRLIKLSGFVGIAVVVIVVAGCGKAPEKTAASMPKAGPMETLGKKADINIAAAGAAVDGALDTTKEALSDVADQAKEIADQAMVAVDTAAEEAKVTIDKSKVVANDLIEEMKPKIDEANKALQKAATDSGKTIEQLKSGLGAALEKKVPPPPPAPPVPGN